MNITHNNCEIKKSFIISLNVDWGTIGETLFDGATTGSIILSKSYAGKKYLEITYGVSSNGSNIKTERFLIEKMANEFSLVGNFRGNYSGIGYSNVTINQRVLVSGTSITRGSTYTTGINNSNNTIFIDGGSLYIFKIIAY